MKKKMREGDVEFMFEAPFPTPELMWQKLKVLALPDGRRYLADIELGGNKIDVARVHRDGVPDEGFGAGGCRVEVLEMVGINRYSGGLLSRDGGGVMAAMSSDTQFGLVCFNADGTLDPDFGQSGKIVHDFFQITGEAEVDRATNPSEASQNAQRTTGGLGAITPGEDGKIFGLVGRRFGSGSGLMRCTSDGQLDPEFNGDGIVLVSHPTLTLPANGVGIVSTSDGGVVVAGTLGANRSDMRAFFCRYNRDGSLDERFGENGFAVFNSETAGIPLPKLYQMELNYVTSLADGGFAACGYLIVRDPWEYYGLVICVDSVGIPIESFNSGKPLLFGLLGAVETDFLFGGIAEQADGKIVVGGGVNERSSGYQRDMLVVRFRSNGSVDSNFGDGGVLRVKPFGFLVSYMSDLLLDSDGKILVAGAGGPSNELVSQRNVVLQFD